MAQIQGRATECIVIESKTITEDQKLGKKENSLLVSRLCLTSIVQATEAIPVKLLPISMNYENKYFRKVTGDVQNSVRLG